MIVIYPVVTSKTISTTVLPGICKALEKYILIYKLDDLLKNVNKEIAKNKKAKKGWFGKAKKAGDYGVDQIEKIGAGLQLNSVMYTGEMLEELESLKEKDYIIEAGKSGKPGKPKIIDPQQTGGLTTNTQTMVAPPVINVHDQSNKQQQGNQTVTQTVQPPEGKMETADVQFGINERSISVEPTYITVSLKNKGTMVLGIKVVPFIAQNERSLVKLMTSDRYRSKASVNIQWQTRRILRGMWKLANVVWKRTIGKFEFTGLVSRELGGGTLSGNHKADIILGRTSFKDELFILLNAQELKESFFQDPKGVTKLFKLKWPSFAVADDVNKSVSFCMNEFKGMCSLINYQFLFSSLSREVGEAFENLEDVKRSSGPLFRMRGRNLKMIKDSKALTKLNGYSKETLIGENILTEDLQDFAKQMKNNIVSTRNKLKLLGTAAAKKDMNTIRKIAASFKFPSNYQTIFNSVRSKNKEFRRSEELANKVLINSLPQLPKNAIGLGAATIAAVAVGSGSDSMDKTKSLLKDVVKKSRSNMKSTSDESFDREIIYAFTFAIVTVVVAAVAAVEITGVLSTLISGVGGAITGATILIVAVLGALLLATMFGGGGGSK